LLKDVDVFEKLRKAILNYDSEAVKKAAQEVIADGLDPLQAINTLTETLRQVGEKFEKFEIFLPELMMAGDAMKAGMSILLPHIPKEKVPKRACVLIGTVKGDIHDIGKTIVVSMLVAAGFEVYDVGVDVPASKFAEESMKVNPDIVAASAIMTTTVPMLKDLIEYFKAIGIRNKCKIMIGGAPVTKEYSEEIGADGYGADAFEAVNVAKKLVSKE
jgi:corrinoid protein of di/trimethylamine methyltransferase